MLLDYSILLPLPAPLDTPEGIELSCRRPSRVPAVGAVLCLHPRPRMPHHWPFSLRAPVCHRRLPGLLSLLLFVLLVPGPLALGQDRAHNLPEAIGNNAPVLRFERIGIEDGMSQQSVTALEQDRQGYLWIGTQDGLHRYDGQEFRIFTAVPFDTMSLAGPNIYAISEGVDGSLWIATDRGLNRFDPATGRATLYSSLPSDTIGLMSPPIYDVFAASNGDVWVVTSSEGVARMILGEGRVEQVRHRADDPFSLSHNVVSDLYEDAEGFVWIGTGNGLNRFDPRTGEVARYLVDPKDDPNAPDARAVLGSYVRPDDPGVVWAATTNGLVRLETETGEYERYLIEPNRGGYNARNRLRAITGDPVDPEVLWATSGSIGLVRFDIRTGVFTTYGNDPKDPHSLSSDYTSVLLADRFGTMWVGTELGGLNSFNPKSVDFVHLRNDPNDPRSIAPGAVYGILVDRSGTLWSGSESDFDSRFVTRLDARTGRVTRYEHDPSNPRSIAAGNLYAIAEDRYGHVWVGHANGGGLSRIDPATENIVRFKHGQDSLQVRRNTIAALLPTDSDLMWVGSYAGVSKLDVRTGNQTIVRNFDGKDVIVWDLFEDHEGTIWGGTHRGLFRVSDDEFQQVVRYDPADTTTIASDFILSILEREREPGILWLATDSGLDRYDTRSGLATHFTVKDGLSNKVVYSLLEDDNGTLWMSTNNGISNLDPETGTFRNYGLDDGLLALEYNSGAYAKGPDGVLYFGNIRGVTVFSPANLSTNEIPPQVIITDLKLFNESLEVGPDSPLRQPLSNTQQVTFAHDQNELTIEFVALHFGNPKRNSYSYQLVGHDDDWVNAGTRRSATYTNLPPGDYTFHVRAANADGVWNEEGATIGLRVLSPWWATWWAYLGATLLLGGLVFGGARLQRWRLERSEAERARLREIQLRAEAQQRRREDAERLSEIGKAITSTLSISEVMDTVYEHVNALMDADVFGIGIYSPGRNALAFPLMKENGETLPSWVISLDEESRPAVWCFNNQDEFIVGDFEKDYQRYLPSRKDPARGARMRSIIYLPLIHQEKPVGVITTQSPKQNAYSDYDVSVLRTLATYAAIALDNAESYRRLDATVNELRTTQEQLVQQEKLASLGALTAGIAHEIKNPLNFVNNFSSLSAELVGELDQALQSGQREEVDEILADLRLNVQKIEEHGRRADSIVRSMMAHARGGEGERREINLNAFVDEYTDLAYHGQRARFPQFNAELIREFDVEAGMVELMPQEIGRVLLNLLSNAFDAVSEVDAATSRSGNGDGQRSPVIRVSTQRRNEHVEITVEDNGPGIPEAVRAKIFEPFFTTKPTGSGTGLGLSLSHDIITKGHGGSLTVDSSVGHGTTFTIRLPVQRAASAASQESEGSQTVR